MRAVVAHSQPMSGKVLQFLLKELRFSDSVLVRSAADALHAVAGNDIDLVILETNLPEIGGPALCRELRARGFNGPLIVIGIQPEGSEMREVLDAGGDDFIVEPIAPHEFLARVQAVIRRYHAEPPRDTSRASLAVGDATLSLTQLTFQRRGRDAVRLTPTEAKLLECLMRNPGIALSRDALVTRVWGSLLDYHSNRVDVYVRRLRHKIEQDPTNPELLITARHVGYLYQDPGAQRREGEEQ